MDLSINIKLLFIVAAVAVGFTEYLKKLLPAALIEKKYTLPILSGIISAASAVLFGIAVSYSWQMILVSALIVVALSQTCYSLLWKTFEAFKAALERKITEKISSTEEMDKAADGAIDAADEALGKVKGKK